MPAWLRSHHNAASCRCSVGALGSPDGFESVTLTTSGVGDCIPTPSQRGSLKFTLYGALLLALETAVMTTVAFTTLRAQAGPTLGTLDITVLDARNDRPLSYAIVKLAQPEIERFSDLRGRIIVASLPPGAYSFSVRRLGFRPSTTAVTVATSAATVITVRLDQVPQQLSKVQVTAAAYCPNPGAPDPVLQPEVHTLVSLLKENAEWYQFLVKQHPFSSTQVRALGDLRDSSTFIQSVEVNIFPSRTRPEYRAGRVVVRRQNKYSMKLPTILDLADEAFAKTHCFFFGGTSTQTTERGEETWVRLDVRADDKLKSPDVNGSFYLDSATAQLRRMEIELSRPDRLPPQLSSIGSVHSTTRFVEIARGLSVMHSVCVVTRLVPSTKKSEAAERAVVPVELQQFSTYTFETPPPDVPAQRQFEVPEWSPLTYMPRSAIWCEVP